MKTRSHLRFTSRTSAWQYDLRFASDRATALGAPHSAQAGAFRAGFTLIELLVVIAIMAIIAGFTLVVVSGIKKTEYISMATGELKQIETALESYKAKYGVYPPSNANPTGTYAAPLTNSLYPQLYYELGGVSHNGTFYTTLDGASQIQNANVQAAFGVGGFVNCSRGGGDEAAPAQAVLSGLRQNQFASVTDNGVTVNLIVTAVRGPDLSYKPLGVQDVNPFRYVYPGVNNPNSYDLWVQLVIKGKTNLICNWSTTVIINSPLP